MSERTEQYHIAYYKKNKEKCNAATLLWMSKNRSKCVEYTKKWREKNKDKYLAYQKDRKNNQDYKKKDAEAKRLDRKNNPEKYREYERKRYLEGKKARSILTEEQKKQRLLYLREYRQKNSEKLKIKDKERRHVKNESVKKRRKTDPLFAIACRCRCRVRSILRNKKMNKKNKTDQILGCSYDFFIKHIESKFQKGMNWENMNLWQIDHIIPLASAKNEEQLLGLLHWSNTQPLWEKENKSKSNKMPILPQNTTLIRL